MDAVVKQETIEPREWPERTRPAEVGEPRTVIELSSSDSDSDDSDDSILEPPGKRARVSNGFSEGLSGGKQKLEELGVVLPLGFLDPLPPEVALPLPEPISRPVPPVVLKGCKQFWKAGDYEGSDGVDFAPYTGGMDHVRVHPKFLHSNATSHKWALGAFAELLDNSLDEICHGVTYVNIDMLENKKDGSRMLLVEDNGGGMDLDKMRQCMSLGYSTKSKLANTIGQYGNGFKTSTMRLGADVIMFSRCRGNDGKSPTQSIGLLSYTFLRSMGKEDIVVPMLDYAKGGWNWNKIIRSSSGDWNRNVETIVHWSPYSSEADLLQQFKLMTDQGTRIIIYNLWEDDQGDLELDFDTDQHDIQIRGVNRDEKKIQMAKQFPNSRHFLTYRHSLRSYASILYLRLSPGFQIILRGKEVEHHNIVNDMMLTQEITYRPNPGTDGVPKETNLFAVVKLGFVKDAKDHIDVQGFNVYHKNRLIKPFWRVWNSTGSEGRGVIGVLEANFVEPAHDKQGFERTIVLSRLEARLIQMQKTYWSTYCHKIGYAPRRHKKLVKESIARETSPDYLPHSSSQRSKCFIPPSSGTSFPDAGKCYLRSNQKQERREPEIYSKSVNHSHGNGHAYIKGENGIRPTTKYGKTSSSSEPASPSAEDVSNDMHPERLVNGGSQKASDARKHIQKNGFGTTQSFTCTGNTESPKNASNGKTDGITMHSQSKTASDNGNEHASSNSSTHGLDLLKEENRELKERLQKKDDSILGDLVRDLQFERDRCKSLETQLREAERKIEEMNKEQEAVIDIFSEERNRRDKEEESLRKKLKDASNTIQELLNKVKMLEKMKSPNCKAEH